MALPSPHETSAVTLVSDVVEWLRLVVEACGAGAIAAGVLAATLHAARSVRHRTGVDFQGTRLVLARYLSLALELQLGADILSTAVAPSWDQIGKLGAIAVIRTFLNFFLRREMHEGEEAPVTPPGSRPAPERAAAEAGHSA